MIAGLNPYPAYKDSGVSWLGEVPAHWEIRRLKTLCSMESGNGITAMSIEPTGEYPVYGGNGLRGYTSNYTHDGNFVLVGRQGALCGNVHVAHGRFWASEHAVVTTAHSGYSPGWLGAILGVMNLNQYSIAAAQPGLSVERVLNLQLPVPPLPEQTAIVRFLDHADRRIQRYIRAKQKLMALLEEQKQAIIHQAVTGQIDVRTGQPYPAYKPSGVEWLGDVPAHWEILPLKRAFVSMDYGISDTGTDDGTIPVLTMGNVRDGTVTVPECGGVTDVAPNLLLQDKDLLFNRTNSAELVAKVGLFRSGKRPVTFASYLVRMRARQENSPEFLNLLLNDIGFVAAARREAIPSLHQSNLNPTRYGRLLILLPSASEQRAIVESVEENIFDVDSAAARANHEIELLREYRTRLIADVVTGKLDVREAAARLPDGEAEPEQFDTAEALIDAADAER